MPLPERRRGGNVSAKFIVFGQCASEAVPVTVVLPGWRGTGRKILGNQPLCGPGVASPHFSNNMQVRLE